MTYATPPPKQKASGQTTGLLPETVEQVEMLFGF